MKRLLIEYQVFLLRIKEIQDFLIKVNKNACVEEIVNTFSGADAGLIDYTLFLKSLSGSQLVYNAIIISLYGCFENYFDKLFGVYLEILSESWTTYAALPKRLKDKYRTKLGEYLSNPQRFNNMDLKLEKEVANYHGLLSSNLIGTINKNFMLSHSGNLHSDEIFLLMKDLGIDNAKDQILNSHLFKTFHLRNGMDEIEFNAKRSRRTEDFFLPIENLISQRNSVAHSWNVEDRITLREINDVIIPFMLMLCDCVFRLCAVQAFAQKSNQKSFKNEAPINVFNNHVVCINNQNQKIAVGDYIVYTSKDKIKIARIKNIQFNGTDILCVYDYDSKNIGIQIDNTIKKTDKLKMVINSIEEK